MRAGAIARWVVWYTNLERKKRGRKPLRPNKALIRAAMKYSKLMCKKRAIGHNFDGTPLQRATRAGFPGGYVGENCALVYAKRKEPSKAVAKKLVNSWMKSKGHRWNMLHAKYNRIGVGIALRWNRKLGMYEVYAVQMFGYSPSIIVEIASFFASRIFVCILIGIVCLIIYGIFSLFSFSF